MTGEQPSPDQEPRGEARRREIREAHRARETGRENRGRYNVWGGRFSRGQERQR